VARQIEAACREHGFFYVTGHGVAPDLLARLTRACAAFFALPQAAKMEIAMARGGPAWRGYFPVGAELTSGRPDLKEGLYFGAELGRDDPRVRAGCRCTAPTCSRGRSRAARGRARLHRRADRSGPGVLRGVALSLGPVAGPVTRAARPAAA
jgi:isopenicillin N synthase-like dioxygenase